MRLATFAIVVVILIAPNIGEPVRVVAAQQQVDTRAFMKQYCISCHTQQAKQRGAVPVTFDDLDPVNIGRDARTWEQVARKMRVGVMPPSGMPRADKATHERFLTAVEGDLDRAARATPNPGRTEAFHRLNRKQYQNAVRDLLNLDIDVTALLPPDFLARWTIAVVSFTSRSTSKRSWLPASARAATFMPIVESPGLEV